MNWIPTEDMIANIFTKPLLLLLHHCHSLALGLCPSLSMASSTASAGVSS